MSRKDRSRTPSVTLEDSTTVVMERHLRYTESDSEEAMEETEGSFEVHDEIFPEEEGMHMEEANIFIPPPEMEEEQVDEAEGTETEEDEGESEEVEEIPKTSEERNLIYRKRILCDRKSKPFTLQWCFGIQLGVPVLNLTNANRKAIAYGASNVGVIYDYYTQHMRTLQGHKNSLRCLCTESNGDYVATSDVGSDGSIIVWEVQDCTPIHTIFNSPEDDGTDFIGLSQNGKYLVTVTSDACPKVKFWLWTFGRSDPDDVMELDVGTGSCRNICFHPNSQEHIMVAFEKQIMFLFWHEKTQTLRETSYPAVRRGKALITDCTYAESCHECLASTTEGCVIVFGNTLYVMNYDERELDNSKYYIKTIKLTKCAINCIKSVDGLFVTGDVRGHIHFFDSHLRLLFWLIEFELGSVISISFNLIPNNYDEELFEIDTDSVGTTRESVTLGYEDRSDEIEEICRQAIPSDATLHKNPFITKDFMILTSDGTVNFVDYANSKCEPIITNNDSIITAIDTHLESPYLVVAYESSKLCLYNYETHKLICRYYLQKAEINGVVVPITCIKYSPLSIRLACGRENGEIWFLEPILLKEMSKYPIQTTKNKVIKICYSEDSMFAAYFDDKMTVISLKYDKETEQWVSCGKVRPHYKPIRDIMFSPYKEKWKLLTVGEDRCLVEYNVQPLCTGILEMNARERLDQSAVPQCFVYYPIQENCRENYILYADDQFKYKIITDSTFMLRSVLLGPAYGCYQESPIQKMIFLPNQKHLVYMTSRYIGIQIFPTDGSPFNYIGMIAHPVKLLDCCTSSDGKYLFTFGEQERCILMYKINTQAADFVSKAGGTELEPFYCLIEGGSNGWLFSEMKDLFFYMQILHQGENTVLPRVVSDRVPLVELPDLMRACGYYPSEFEVENLIIDVKYKVYDWTLETQEDLSFIDFVKLYLNHRVPHGIAKQKLERAFSTFCTAEHADNVSTIQRDSFIDLLCARGEVFTRCTASKCLRILLNVDVPAEDVDKEDDFDFLQQVIGFDYLMNDILGVDMERNFDKT